MLKNGDLPKLFNYSGRRFHIKDIIGTFSKYNNTKQIKFQQGKLDKNITVDKFDRRVNSQGYLIDK